MLNNLMILAAMLFIIGMGVLILTHFFMWFAYIFIAGLIGSILLLLGAAVMFVYENIRRIFSNF